MHSGVGFLGGVWSLPYSPRWLLEQGRDDEALAVVKKLNDTGVDMQSDDIYLFQFNQMQQQIRYEKENTIKRVFKIIATNSARKRLLLAVLV
jgi:hypothetical protein